MRNIFFGSVGCLAVITSLLVVSRETQQDERVEVKMWDHIVDPYGNPVALPEQIRWEVDAETCGKSAKTITGGMHWASAQWIGISGVDIRQASPDEKINLAVYCAPFGKTYSEAPRAYRIRTLEVENDSTLKSIAVEVPSNWMIVEEHSDAELDTAGRMFWNAKGGAYFVIGLGLGLKHAYAPGANANVPGLDDSQFVTKCVKNCDT